MKGLNPSTSHVRIAKSGYSPFHFASFSQGAGHRRSEEVEEREARAVMIGPYGKIDTWLENRLSKRNSSHRISRLTPLMAGIIFILPLFAGTTAIGLSSLYLDVSVVHTISARRLVVVTATIGLALAIFTLGYLIHLAKRWLRETTRRP
jgi:hypothetical protein